jgi:hypothetical protein
VLPPDQLWHSPPNDFVARVLGLGNVLDYVRAGSSAATPWGDVPLPSGAPASGRLLIRADALSLDPDGTIGGTVRSATFRGDHVRVLLEADADAHAAAYADADVAALARTEPAALEAELRGAKVRVGELLTLAVTPGSVTVFAPHETDD